MSGKDKNSCSLLHLDMFSLEEILWGSGARAFREI